MSSLSEYMPADFAQTYAFEEPVKKPKTAEEKSKEQTKKVANEAAKSVLANSQDPVVQEKKSTKVFTAKVLPGEDADKVLNALNKKVAGVEESGPKSTACQDKKQEKAKADAELADALEATKESTTGGDEANKKAKEAAAVKELVE